MSLCVRGKKRNNNKINRIKFPFNYKYGGRGLNYIVPSVAQFGIEGSSAFFAAGVAQSRVLPVVQSNHRCQLGLGASAPQCSFCA